MTPLVPRFSYPAVKAVARRHQSAADHLDVNRREADSPVQRLSSAMLTARHEAVTRQHNMIVTIDQLNRRVRVIWDVNGSGTVDAGERIQVVSLGSLIS